jgi:DNA-binding IclR family transcriptional regulator
MNKPIPVKTTKTAFDVVNALVELNGAQLSELADHLEMPTSTTHDHVRTLASIGMVVEEDSKYTVSTRFLEIGEAMRTQMKIYQVAYPEVQILAEETGEHASLMIEEGGLGVLLFISKGENAVNLNAYAGRRLILSATAPGKAILAHLPRERIQYIIDEHGFHQYTPNTIVNENDLWEEIESVREQGYATDVGELLEGVRAISVPILSRGEVQGAITIGGPASRMSGVWFEEELPNLLLRSSNIIELNLSHS